jgi:hypothetical protein
MSTYNGRRGPNVSHFLRDLNTVGPDTAQDDEAFKIEEDLAMFTNTQFFDFESGQNTDFQAHPLKPAPEVTVAPTSEEPEATSPIGDLTNLDFISGEYFFGLIGVSTAFPWHVGLPLRPTLFNFQGHLSTVQRSTINGV